MIQVSKRLSSPDIGMFVGPAISLPQKDIRSCNGPGLGRKVGGLRRREQDRLLVGVALSRAPEGVALNRPAANIGVDLRPNLAGKLLAIFPVSAPHMVQRSRS